MSNNISNDNENFSVRPSKKSLDRQNLIENGKNKHPTYGNGNHSNHPDEKKTKDTSVSIRQLFRFATKLDIFLLFIGTLCALVNGAAWPCNLLILEDTITSLVAYRELTLILEKTAGIEEFEGLTQKYVLKHVDEFLPLCPNITRLLNYTSIDCDDFKDQTNIYDDMKDQAVLYACFGVAVLTCAMAQVVIFITTSERQAIRIRKAFYRSILRQDLSWFDHHSAGELTVKMTDDINHIHDAVGDKTGTSIQWFGAAVAGLVVAFTHGWELTLVMVSAAPAMAIAFGILAKTLGQMTQQEREAYAQAGSVAEEVFTSMRTVAAFGGQEKEAERYKHHLLKAQEVGIKKSKFIGFSIGSVWSIIYCFLAVGFYYGGKLVRDGDYEIKDMVVVFLASLIGSYSIGLASPAFSLVKVGCGTAYEVFRIIDQPSKIDCMSKEGQKPVRVKGVVRFQNVHFSYPSRPGVKILDGIDLTVTPGQTVALVGHSGCGKSTMTQLLMRFYDADSGIVSLDGRNVKDLNVKFLRQNIGIVSQEPVLFPTTIQENIRYGREDVTKEEVIEAAKKANAYDFIMNMPEGFDCYVGERGAQLSGGQKQRIAIARSLVREPCVLLLDEATSALDRTSEAIVQDALNKASTDCTTIIIAHRLSTIRHADVILVMDKGRVVEQGTHDALMAQGGVYYSLVNAQSRKYDPEGNDDAEHGLDKEYLDEALDKADVNLKRNRTLSFTKEVNEEDLKIGRWEAAKRLARLTSPEWVNNFNGCLASLFNGAVQPVWGFLLAETLIIFTKDDDDDEKKEMNKLSFICLALAATSLISYTVQHYNFGISGERLIGRIRSIGFKAMLRQEIGWFDEEKHQSAVLGAQLAERASLVKGAVQAICMSSLMCVGVVASALSLGFIFSWRLTLIAVCFMPLIILSGILTVKETQGMSEGNKTTLEDASKEAMAAVANIRTVASLTKEELFVENFSKNLDECFRFNLKSTLMMATGLAVSCSSYYFTFSAMFYYGSVLLEDDIVDAIDVFRVFNCIILSSVQLGKMMAVAPDTKGALTAARQIFALEDSVPSVDPYSKKGFKPASESVLSTVRFSDVHFRYPMRPDVKVLSGLDLQVDPGEMLALVGESGSGKSTVVQLLERFYRPNKGTVSIDQYNIADLNVQWLRSQIGLVAQEPVLFDTTIAENIAYGDNTRVVSMDEIIAAARVANIHNFIDSLPQGYDTNVGDKGTQLSGGQKQRIAIARALVRNPKVLLLDEATSALDTESEKIVQDALDKAREGRTCITIAHRLSTIKHADKIAVIRKGVVHEQGNHAQLMNMHGLYHSLQTQI